MGDQLPGGRQPETEGERYLVALDLAHLADKEISTSRGTIPAKDFLKVCGEHARPVLKGFAGMSPTHPRYRATKKTLQSMIGKYIEGDQPDQ